MNRVAMMAILAGVMASGLAQAQLYTGFDSFSDRSGSWSSHEVLGKTEVTNGLLRISRNHDEYTDFPDQWINMTMNVSGCPEWEYDIGTHCDMSDYYRVTGLVRAPHKNTKPLRRYQIGVGYLDAGESEIGLMIQDSAAGRKLVATYKSGVIKTQKLGGPFDMWLLRVTYAAASRTLAYWYAPAPLSGSPSWIRLCTYAVPESDLSGGDMLLDPGILGHIVGNGCRASWNVGVSSFSYSFNNK